MLSYFRSRSGRYGGHTSFISSMLFGLTSVLLPRFYAFSKRLPFRLKLDIAPDTQLGGMMSGPEEARAGISPPPAPIVVPVSYKWG